MSSSNVSLYLIGLEEIDAEVAQALTGFAGVLGLDGLKIINARIAESLSQARDSLSLAGLESITADVANELAKFKGDLNLSGLKEPKEEIVQALEKKKMGTLYLSQDVLDKFPALAKNELVEVWYGGGMGGGMF